MASVKADDGTSSGLSPGARTFGVWGDSKDNFGVIGTSSTLDGVAGESDQGNGVFGRSNIGYGIVGTSSKSTGVHGESDDEYGVGGLSKNVGGMYGQGKTVGVVGNCDSSIGVFGNSSNSNGIVGQSDSSYGVFAVSGKSIAINATGGTAGAYSHNNIINTAGGLQNDVHLSTQSNAGEFNGNISVVGSITKSGGGFQIDHPIDPTNKYLYHSFVESSDMKNVYDGVVILDQNGKAEVQLPGWFGALNKDFRYQLTAIGAPAPNLCIEEEISNKNSFKISGGKGGIKVSWQVTGIRHDHWADANRVKVEEDKPAQLRGYYVHPNLYDKPADKSIEYVRYKEQTDMDARAIKTVQEVEQSVKDKIGKIKRSS